MKAIDVTYDPKKMYVEPLLDANDNDENVIPNPSNVGLGLPFEKDKLTAAYSPVNFLYTKTYGIAPSNTTLTIRYLTGGGVSSNVEANTLTSITPGFAQFNQVNLIPLQQTATDILGLDYKELNYGLDLKIGERPKKKKRKRSFPKMFSVGWEIK